MFRPLLAALVLGLPLAGTVSTALAAKGKVWNQQGTAPFDKAHFKSIVLSSDGALRLSRQLKPLAALQATHVWDVVEDARGNLFVATGDEGKVYKVTPDGNASVVYTSADSQVLCLAAAGDGTVYAGTGPTGLVVALPPAGKARIVGENLGAYVWSLALDPPSHTLYAGTGPKGRIFEIRPDGPPRVFYATRQEHVLCVARGPDGMLFAGTDKGGLVYRIDQKGKGFVLYQTAQAEVRSLLVTADGVYAGTSAPTRRHPLSRTGSTAGGYYSALASGPAAGVTTKEGQDSAVRRVSTGSSGTNAEEEKSEAKTNTAPAPTPAAGGENSVYRLNPDGSVRELFRDKTLMLSLLRQGGSVLVGTGMQGQLFEIDEASRERSELARLDHGQIHALCQRRDGSVVLGTGDPGKLYALQAAYSPRGTVTSEVLDAKVISFWGALTWKADVPPGTTATLAVRSGNVAEPDETWSDWSAEQTDPARSRAIAPAARFVQYRLTLTTENPRATAVVRGVALRYRPSNQAPEVTKIEVPDPDAGNVDNAKKVKLKWSVVDPNEDELTYRLLVRKEGWKDWVCLEEELDRREYEWDTGSMPSGVYQVKVVASDRKDNPEEEALTAERVSTPFPVTHEPPAVRLKVAGIEGDRAVIEATATDRLVRLAEASFAVNGKKWVNVFPQDGLFDARSESFRFKTAALRPGTYVLVLRVRNAAGVVGSGDVVFTVRAGPAR